MCRGGNGKNAGPEPEEVEHCVRCCPVEGDYFAIFLNCPVALALMCAATPNGVAVLRFKAGHLLTVFSSAGLAG